MRSLLLCVLLVCGCRKPPAPSSAKQACQTDDDCTRPFLCVGGECADPRTKALFTDPQHAVTPEKVKRQVEQVEQRHEDDVDKAIERANQQR